MRVSELAVALGCPFEGDGDHEIQGVGDLDDGGAACLGFVRSESLLPRLASSRLGAVVALPSADVGGRPVIRSPNPGLHFARAIELFSLVSTITS